MMGHVDVHVIHMANTVWRFRAQLAPSEKLVSERTLEELDLDQADIEMIRTCPSQECEPALRGRLRELEKRG